MKSIKRKIIERTKGAAPGVLACAISVLLMSVVFPDPVSSQNTASSSESPMCLRLKEITTEFPNTVTDRLLGGHAPEERCREYFWYVLKVKSLNEILNASQLEAYNAAIAERDCQIAMRLLYPRFADAHPRATFILKEKDELDRWKKIAVGNHFHDLFLCRRLAEIDEAQRELEHAGMDPTPYRGSPFSQSDVDNIGERSGQLDARVEARDRPIAILLRMNLSGKSPVYSLALLKLSQAGVALELHPLWELFLAFRLRDAGNKDPLVTSILSRPIDPKVRAEIEKHARDELTGWFQVPVHPQRPYPKDATAD